ncbi:MAG: 6,7-dimethyl-8-ribityllumazine synthase [Opitutales bacterium]|nr:6,7-dimethyl-8-ribityllumazine synthase [Opitutales bacterium]
MSLDRGSKPKFDASCYRFGIVAARFNEELTDALLNDALATIFCAGVPSENVRVMRVPGSGELPHTCNLLASSGDFDAVIALGVVIAGETPHHMIIGNSTAFALQEVALDCQVPVINGIVVAETRAQAEERTIGSIKRGVEFAEAALEMAWLTDSFLAEYDEDGE